MKDVGYWKKDRYRSTEQNRLYRIRCTYTWLADFWLPCQGNYGEKKIFSSNDAGSTGNQNSYLTLNTKTDSNHRPKCTTLNYRTPKRKHKKIFVILW